VRLDHLLSKENSSFEPTTRSIRSRGISLVGALVGRHSVLLSSKVSASGSGAQCRLRSLFRCEGVVVSVEP
jgi:hypothetical protein